MALSKAEKARREQEISDARELLMRYFAGIEAGEPEGPYYQHKDRYVYVTNTNYRSGGTRSIKAMIVRDGELIDISPAVARVLGRRFDTVHGGVKADGGGMDMGFELVYALSVCLFGHGDRGGYTLHKEWV